ncbi:hypothetical protein M422DRAFT_175428 [Sphaerobolus stellatus SS14]|uniref:Phosphatase 2A Regulatory Subunit A helical domain-containing protein n=1 Tax=Sphaerobolus stellatus (strain SS14) TaxID=990650 RepID=A0A0C9U8K1_SPHS4|nr:hypothetical protein M422DRAFT_175428 [Sphaerobolus stellatus SS14]
MSGLDKVRDRNFICNDLFLSLYLFQGAAAFMASATRHLPPTDTWCILYPSLKFSLRSDVKVVNENTLLATLKPPVSP